MLNRNLPIPLYHQLKSALLQRIEVGEWAPQDQLPTESDLALQSGVSKITVRQALKDLADAGYVRREQGRGTFVLRTRLAQGPRELTSFSDEMLRHGLKPSSRVISQDVIEADEEIASHLELKTGAPVFRLCRLRLADGQPMGLQTAHIPLAIAPGIQNEAFDNLSLYDCLTGKFRLLPAHARETHFAVLVEDKKQASLLQVPRRTPVMAAERVTYLTGGQPFEFVRSIMRGDRYKIVLDLVKTAESISSGV